MMKQQQAYEERQSALFAQMAAQEENFRRQKEEMMEQMKIQQELYLQQQSVYDFNSPENSAPLDIPIPGANQLAPLKIKCNCVKGDAKNRKIQVFSR